MGKTITGSTPAPSFNPTPTPLWIGANDHGISRITPTYLGASVFYFGSGLQGDYFGAIGGTYFLVNGSVDFGYFSQGANHQTISFDGRSDPGLLFKGGDTYGMKLTGTALQIKSSTSIAWSNDLPYNATLDVGLCRLSSGLIGVSDGSATPNANGEIQMAGFNCHSGGADMFAWVPGSSTVGLHSGVLIRWGSTAYLGGNLFLGMPVNGVLGVSTTSSLLNDAKVAMGKINVSALQVFVNNAAAIAGGLAAGDFYRTGLDPDVVCVVH